MNKEILAVLSDTPWPINSGGKIDCYFMLKALKQSNCRTFVIFPYSHKEDVEGFSERAKEVCDGWYAYPRKKNILRMLHPYIPYYLFSNKPSKKETSSIKIFLKDHKVNPDFIVMNSLNGYYLAYFISRFYPNAKFVYRMQNVESDYYRSIFNSFPFFSARKWLMGLDLFRTNRLEATLLANFKNIACISKRELTQLQGNQNQSAHLYWIPPFFDFGRENTLDENESKIFSKLKSQFGDKPVLFCANNFYGSFNVSAVQWFIQEVLPVVQAYHPVYFLIGGFKAEKYFRTDNINGIHVFSDFHSVKPFMLLSSVVLILTFGKAGVKLKLVEALSYEKRIVSTLEGVYGSGVESLVPNSNDPKKFAAHVLDQLSTTGKHKEELNSFFTRHFDPLNNVRNLLFPDHHYL